MTYNILLPTDGSLPAITATVKAVELAKERGGMLTVLKVVEQDPITYTERVAESSALQRPIEEDGVLYAQQLAVSNKVPVKVMIREGAVVGEILKVARELPADCIVMGKSSPRGLNRLYLGDVAEAVVGRAPCNVLVVKPTEEQIRVAKQLMVKPEKEKAVEVVNNITRTRRFRVGFYLFAIYIVGYAVFTIFGTYLRDAFGSLLLGMNLAILSGLLLIVVAIAMAVGFNWYAGRAESRGEH